MNECMIDKEWMNDWLIKYEWSMNEWMIDNG